MNPLSTAIIIAGFGNLLKSHFESEIWAKIFSKSANPFASHPLNKTDASHKMDT